MIKFRPSCPADLPYLRQLWKEAFGDSEEYLDLFFRTAYTPERSRILERNGIAGAAYWLDCSFGDLKLAYVYAVAIRKADQNQGLGVALMEELHRHLATLGYDAVLLVPGEEGLRGYYRRLGYETVSYQNRFTATAGTAVAMTRLDSRSYAQARSAYLEGQGVLQEAENLTLLEEIADFFKGEGFLAAVCPGDGICLELLGDDSFAPGITAALGLKRCSFRTPGDQIPYAMARSLGPKLTQTLYFGFGFD